MNNVQLLITHHWARYPKIIGYHSMDKLATLTGNTVILWGQDYSIIEDTYGMIYAGSNGIISYYRKAGKPWKSIKKAMGKVKIADTFSYIDPS